MDDDDDGKVMVINRPRSSIKHLLGVPNSQGTATGGEDETQDYTPPPKKSDPLPRPGDPYRPCANFLNRLATEQRLIHFVDGQCFSEGFNYHDLRRMSWRPNPDPGKGPILVLRFVEAVVTEVEIHGGNLEDIRYYIGQGLMPWVWEKPSGIIADAQAAVITRITFTILKRNP